MLRTKIDLKFLIKVAVQHMAEICFEEWSIVYDR